MAGRTPSNVAPGPPRLILVAVVLVVAVLGIVRGRELAEMIRLIALRLVKEERQ